MPSNAVYTSPHPLANGGATIVGARDELAKPPRSADPTPADEDEMMRAKDILDMMHATYPPIPMHKQMGTSLTMDHRGWYAKCCGGANAGSSPIEAVRGLAMMYARNLADARWTLSLLSRFAITPDDIACFAEGVSTALDMTEDSP